MISVTNDPLNRFPNHAGAFFYNSLGRLPEMFDAGLRSAGPIHLGMLNAYGFGGSPMTGGTVADNGVYTYPEDPPLYPIAKMEGGPAVVWVYDYGICAIVEDHTTVYRFD